MILVYIHTPFILIEFQSFGAPVSSGGPPSTNATSSAPSYPSGAKTGPMTVSHGLVPRPAAPSNSYATYAGQRPPMYPGK